ncbi:MAG TPA: outer membrane beta-barrel protein [Chthoniobacterales bacterium]|nr:outer membrane beta-barrel protein [Chthoniobacterales bacterium]
MNLGFSVSLRLFLPILSICLIFEGIAAPTSWAQEALFAVTETTTDPNGTTIAPEQSIDLSAEINPPLPVAATDDGPDTAPATSVDSGIPRRFHYQFRLGVRGVYDDNINLSQDDRISDWYTSIEPAIMLGFGDTTDRVENYIQFNYLPAIFLFADHSENNSVQHVARLDGQYRINRLTLNLSQMVQIMDGVDVQTQDAAGGLDQQVNLDVAGRTRFNIYTTHLNAAYYVAGKTFLSSGLDYTATHYSSLISSDAFSGNFFLNYDYSSKLTVGIGGSAGFNTVDEPSPDQQFQQANVRLSYRATGKIDFAASGGVEFRQFDGDLRDQYISPVFEIGVNYAPFDGTKLSITANRRTLNSAVLASQNYAVSNISAGLQQRLFQRFFLGINGGYENSEYYSTVGAAGPERSDNYFFIQPSIAVRVTRFWSVGAYYSHRVNDSSFDAFSFHDNQVGFRSGLTF